MSSVTNVTNSKNVVSVLKYHITAYGKYYNFEILATCHTNALKKPTGPDEYKGDLIGLPHPVSNLRPIHFYIPDNEAPIEKEFRLKRQEVQKWNQDFWVTHNTKFVKERKAFVEANQQENSDTLLSADEMSVFYKTFLDKTWRTHLDYNTQWYRKNAQLILLHLRVKMFYFSRMLKRGNNAVDNKPKS